jgi:hypothetical protein
MNVLFDLLQSQLGGEQFNQTVSNQLGIEEDKAGDAVQAAFSAIMAGISNNVTDQSGAQGLLGALDRDHDGSILDNVMGYLSGNMQSNNSSMLNGAGIINHVLGGNQSNVIDTIAKATGIDASKAGKLLVTLAPIVLGMLGKMKKTNNVQSNTLLDLIMQGGRPQPVQEAAEPQGGGFLGMFSKLLDKNNDGNVMDDIAKSGINMVLKNFFNK